MGLLDVWPCVWLGECAPGCGGGRGWWVRAGAEDMLGKDRVCQTALARGRRVYVMVWVVCARGVHRADRQLRTDLRPLLQRTGRQ